MREILRFLEPGQKLEDIFTGIEFASIKPVMQVYCEALSGKEVDIYCDARAATSFRNIWFEQMASGNTPDGHLSITVPSIFTEYPDYESNFNWYKSALTQQIGHFEFGSFNFNFNRESALFENLRPAMSGEDNKGSVSELERYFALFGGRILASRIFAAVENVRINYLVKYYYAGVKQSYRRMQESTLAALNQLAGMTLRRAFCELLEGLEIDAMPSIEVDALRGSLNTARDILIKLCSPLATVEDSAEAAIRIYEIALKIPKNIVVSSADGHVAESRAPNFSDLEGKEFQGNSGLDKPKLKTETRLSEVPKTIMPATGEDLKYSKGFSSPDLIQSTPSIASAGISPGDLITDVHQTQFQVCEDPNLDRRKLIIPQAGINPEPGEKLFFYDEWDFRAKHYMVKWCCIREKVLEEGNSGFYENTLERRKSLVAEIKRQFEKLPAELMYKVRNLEDGDEFDLDMVIREIIDKKAGYAPTGRVYLRKKRIQRDVSVAFLVDMSISTADLIYKGNSLMEYDESMIYDARRPPLELRLRVIDVEKESLVLLMHSIETLGDNYGIYGFSGQGHSKVKFLVIKDFNEAFTEKVKRRVDMIAPIGATRMGPAIRHATARLAASGSSLKLLFVVSDGCPQDTLYGYNDDDKEYAIHDTKMALIEAVRKNVTPFCLTIDSHGNDYLRTMCSDISYEVLDDVVLLPQRLPMLYKKLSV